MPEVDQPLANLPIPPIREIDLTATGVYQHFVSSGRRGQLVNYLLSLDRMDRWAVDHNELTSPDAFAIQLLLKELSSVVEASAALLHRVPQEFATVLAHLTTTRCMYVIRYVSQHNPAFLDSLGELLGSDRGSHPDLAVIRRRFEAFSKGRLLGEIFSGKRLERIVSIMGSYR